MIGIYIRVSTEEQAKEGYSIAAQRKKLEAFCVSQGWTSYRVFPDEGRSAKDLNRPQLKKMMQMVEEGLITTVLVYRLDRFTRSVRDLYKLLDTLNAHGCTFKSATELYDTSTALGRLFITLVAAMAQWERENLGERVKMGQIEKARQGEYSAKAPFGFDKDENSKLVINKDEEQVIFDMIAKLKEGYSLRQLAFYMDDESGIPPIRSDKWNISVILAILKNPALHGDTFWAGETIEDTHQGILTRQEHKQLLKMLSDRQNKKKRRVNSFFVYQMKLVCPSCGNHLTSERCTYLRKTDNVLSEHNRYRCQPCALNRKPAISVSEKQLEIGFIKYMQNFKVSRLPQIEKQKKEDKYTELLNRIERVKRQRIKYQKAWSRDQMTDEEFDNLMSETKNNIDNLMEELQALPPVEEQVTSPEMMLEIVNNFNLNWTRLTPREKHEFLNTFIKEIHFEKEGKTAVITDVVFY